MTKAAKKADFILEILVQSKFDDYCFTYQAKTRFENECLNLSQEYDRSFSINYSHIDNKFN